jgi:D-xylose transport system ATP-binding protein
MGLVGGNGAGKTTLMRALSGARPPDSGTILVDGEERAITNPRDAKALGIETIYQTLALADNVDAPANVFLGREMTSRWGTLDDSAMEDATRKVMGRLNPNFERFTTPVRSLSGGQRQGVAIARAVYFNARILIMDEPTAALGPAETSQVHALIRQLKQEGIGIFLISHDIHDVFDLSDRISVMYHGRLVDTVRKDECTTDEVLGMIILGKKAGDVTERELAELHG